MYLRFGRTNSGGCLKEAVFEIFGFFFCDIVSQLKTDFFVTILREKGVCLSHSKCTCRNGEQLCDLCQKVERFSCNGMDKSTEIADLGRDSSPFLSFFVLTKSVLLEGAAVSRDLTHKMVPFLCVEFYHFRFSKTG